MSLKDKSKMLAFLLRHDKDYQFDNKGYRDIDDLIKNHNFTISELEEIVSTDDKGRYEFNDSKNKIRARQGHSINVDVELEECTPPDVLYHGTAHKFLESITEQGLIKGNRQYVHLSEDKDTAVKVGIRRDKKPVIIIIDSKQMTNDGIKFYRSRNNVWLTDYVNPKYFHEIYT